MVFIMKSYQLILVNLINKLIILINFSYVKLLADIL